METTKRRMASLRTICQMYDWKYDSVWRKWKKGKFVEGYKDPVGRGLLFDLAAVDQWAHQLPVNAVVPSLISNRL